MALINILNDKFLSEILNKDVFQVQLCIEDNQSVNSDIDLNLLNSYLKQNVFIYIKVPSQHIQIVQLFEKVGFRIVDTNVSYEKKVKLSPIEPVNHNLRFSILKDKQQVCLIAKNNFIFSRFHQDRFFSKNISDNIKLKWTENFFLGNRGNSMIVAYNNDTIMGFLLLILKDKVIIVDLIAVDSQFQKQGIGKNMIQYAENNLKDFELIKVGTQIINRPSISLYENMGFKITSASYVLHFHNLQI